MVVEVQRGEVEKRVDGESAGRAQLFGWHVPAGDESTPRVQVTCNDPELLYPVLQAGLHVLPDGMGERQLA